MNMQTEYVIRGRRVGSIGVMQDIIVLRATGSQHALERAQRLYEAGWEHLQPFAVSANYRPDLERA